jgi:hypothetical protein
LKDPSFTTKVGTPVIQRLLNNHMWSVEDADRWVTEDNENYFYSISSSQYDHHQQEKAHELQVRDSPDADQPR